MSCLCSGFIFKEKILLKAKTQITKDIQFIFSQNSVNKMLKTPKKMFTITSLHSLFTGSLNRKFEALK